MISLLRRSLTARTVFATMVLSGLALVTLGGFLSYSLANSFYQNRLEQVLDETERAVSSVQNTIAAASLTDETALQTLINSVVPSLEISGGSGTRQVALLRSPGQPQLQLFQSPISRDLELNSIPDKLRTAVRDSTGILTYTPIQLVRDGQLVPGITVGAPLSIPLAGNFELYLVFDLAQEQASLTLVQNALAIAGLILIVLFSGVSYYVTRRIVRPVELAAQAAENLAQGKLDERLSEKGHDVIASWAKSFNRMANNLQGQITQLDSLSRMQRRFVSDVSHELRTPLTTIKLAGEVIFGNREKLEPALSRSAELMQNQIERFEKLLADLLEISRYDAGAVTPDMELQDLNAVVGAAIASIEPLAQSMNTQIEVVLPGSSVEAEFDASRIERLLRNLLSNAVEHGEGKPIRVEVAQNANAVAVCVTDSGVGMSKQQLERVFDRFWRADPSRKRSVGGTGLGLAISKEDATLHRGWLQVWSRPQRGSSFRLTLPKRKSSVIANSPLPLPPRAMEL
ncbi:MAG: HAMP domain-containing histidine kinase [Aquiluna sp.]|nr:HAMP domain-containing histidine kinase [Aquiluna sp.]MCF8546275.1 HAMP domain-containing histidine kinase [Aquiluna sp.]